MHPRNILNISPPIDLYKEIQNNNFKELNVYIDFKNCTTSLFIDEVVQEIVHNSNLTGFVDSNIFQSTLFIASQWKEFAIKNNLKFRIFFCHDKGRSEYHYKIYNRYKINRLIGTVDLPSYYDELTAIKRQNSDLSEVICNQIPNMYFLNLKSLESDFLPYYLIKLLNTKETLNIVLSSDKDLYQCLLLDNTYLVFKKSGIVNLIKKDSIYRKYIKLNNLTEKNRIKKTELIDSVNVEYYPAIMSIVGDNGDNIPGIDKIGEIRAIEAFSHHDIVKSLIGGSNELVCRIVDNGNFIDNNLNWNCDGLPGIWKKIIEHNDIITRNFKLISFELLCSYLNKRSDLYSIHQLDYINSIMNRNKNKDITSPNIIIKALNNLHDSNMKEDDIRILFD